MNIVKNINSIEFPYDPIDITIDTVRLLRIGWGEDDSITGELEHFPLDASDRPEYLTLSYVWGQKDCSNEIKVNGHALHVLDSLYPILQLICNTPKLSSSWWWIDSICINQSDDRAAKIERGSQIQMMGRIYKRSETTVGWLGEASEDEEEAIDFLYVLRDNRNRLRTSEQRAAVQELSGRREWAALESMLLKPWWRRVWTLQEYIIARKFVFYFGTRSIDREDLKPAIYAIYRCRQIDESLIKLQSFQPAWNRRRLYMWYGEVADKMPLLALMAYCSDSETTDQRDRIYSLLGLAGDRELGIPPDYNSDVGKAYTTLVKSFVDYHKSLDIICFAHLFNQYDTSVNIKPKLPSWVPDWRVQTEPFVIPVMVSQSSRNHVGNFRPPDKMQLGENVKSYAASGTRLPETTFLDDDQTLICKGILVDYVDGIGGIMVTRRGWDGRQEDYEELYGCINSTSPININHRLDQESTENANTMDDLSRCLVLDREDRYLSYPTPSKLFADAFKALCHKSMTKPATVQDYFGIWFQLNRSLFIRGRSLEQLCNESRATERPPDSVDINDSKNFLSRFIDTSGSMVRRLITTNQGYIGMGPCRVQKGDQICVLFGCSVPLILRQQESQSSYEVIGECYLHGFMNGEALRDIDSRKVICRDFQLL